MPAESTANSSMANPAGAGAGQKRQKVLGYIKAANELRQSYQQSLSTKWQEGDYQEGIPGAFPDADIVRSGDEEMLLFPSYARRHIKATHPSQDYNRSVPGAQEDLSNPEGGDAEYWRREWQRYEDQNAVVDVDVRGWIYNPQRGPLNRRNRLLLAVARRLSGIPAPTNSPAQSRESSRGPAWRERVHEDLLGQEEEAAAREAELITRRVQKENEAVSRGRYASNASSLLDDSPSNSRSSSPTRPTPARTNTASESDTASLSANSANNTTAMSKDQVLAANEMLMTRLRPFMTMPLANTPITIFFYNDQKSQSKSVYTDESGHFKMRAALDFVPNKVRVLASEKLSATEDVHVTDERGVSVVSDIDDTIKHSAIANGAKEIFKNTFIRELGDLTIPGVKEWYNTMSALGCKMHYVSNSPWQLYPLLRSYFSLAGLPPGSFHLKQYSGMLQGIFEPAGERKKGSLDRIMHDFPERKFVLIGDSGEADLEVYTDVVQEHPGRVLAVYIRDVTSKSENNLKDFFHSSHRDDGRGSRTSSPISSESQKPDAPAPKLPERPKSISKSPGEDLIDFSEDTKPPTSPRPSYAKDLDELKTNGRQPPEKPAKPSNLRSMSTAAASPPRPRRQDSSNLRYSEGDQKKPAPPPPPTRRTTTNTSSRTNTPTNGQERYYTQNQSKVAPPAPSSSTLWQESSHYSSSPVYQEDTGGYLATARHQLANAYNALPTLRTKTSNSSLNSIDSATPNSATSGPQLPPRRGLSSYPAAAARFVTGATGGDPSAGGDGGAPGAPYDKKLEMWRRRWARSEEIMKKHGVILRVWRNGTDVMEECVTIVEREVSKYEDEVERRQKK